MVRLGLWLGVTGVVIVAFLLYPQYPVLDVTTVRDSRLLLCARMAEGEEFILSFVHSVNKRPVYDTIRMEGNHLRVVMSRYDSFGAGMPEATANGMRLQIAKDGWMEWIVDRPVPEVTFYVGWVAEHSLRLKGRDIALKSLVEPGTLLSLHPQKASWYRLWKGRCVR